MDIPSVYIDHEYAKGVLMEFLKLPLHSTDELFFKFRTSLDSYIFKSHMIDSRIRFLFHRGHRENKVLLVAHVDTFFTQERGYKITSHNLIEYPKGNIISDDPERGLGADDRAGCTMLYLLKDMGHSLLILDSEETSTMSARWLTNNFPSLSCEINSHQFMIELDLQGNSNFKTYHIGTPEFEEYIKMEFGFNKVDSNSFSKGGTDIVDLAKEICGVNLSVGYNNQHRVNESININYWYETLTKLHTFLQKPDIPKFERKMEHIGYEL